MHLHRFVYGGTLVSKAKNGDRMTARPLVVKVLQAATRPRWQISVLTADAQSNQEISKGGIRKYFSTGSPPFPLISLCGFRLTDRKSTSRFWEGNESPAWSRLPQQSSPMRRIVRDKRRTKALGGRYIATPRWWGDEELHMESAIAPRGRSQYLNVGRGGGRAGRRGK